MASRTKNHPTNPKTRVQDPDTTDLSQAVKTLTELREQIASHQAQIKVLRAKLNQATKSAQQRLTIASGGSIRKSRPRVKRSCTTDVDETWDFDQDEMIEEYESMDLE
jgi:multidrug resistance efflux pump